MDFDLNLRNLGESNEFVEKLLPETSGLNSTDHNFTDLSIFAVLGHSELIDEEYFQPSSFLTSKNVDLLMFDSWKLEDRNPKTRKTSIASVDDSHILVDFKVTSTEIRLRNFNSFKQGKKEARISQTMQKDIQMDWFEVKRKQTTGFEKLVSRRQQIYHSKAKDLLSKKAIG